MLDLGRSLPYKRLGTQTHDSLRCDKYASTFSFVWMVVGKRGHSRGVLAWRHLDQLECQSWQEQLKGQHDSSVTRGQACMHLGALQYCNTYSKCSSKTAVALCNYLGATCKLSPRKVRVATTDPLGSATLKFVGICKHSA